MRIKTLLLLIVAAIAVAVTGCATTTTTMYRSKAVEVRPSGVYVGALAFGSEAVNVTGGRPVFLNEEGALFLTRAVSVRYQHNGGSGVTVGNAAESAAAAVNGQREFLPDNVESVNLVVFSDRLPAGALPPLKAAGRDVNVYTVDDLVSGGGSAGNVVSKIAPTSGKSAVVWLVLDAAPLSGNTGVESAKTAALNLLDGLSKRVDLSQPTPLTEIYIDEDRTKKKVKVEWGETLIAWGVSILCVALIVGVAALVVASESE